MMERARVRQCKSCPWRVGCIPDTDIPRYRRELHENLRGTIQSGIPSLLTPVLRIMACHYSEAGADIVCAGWLANQLGGGNNIGVRLAVSLGRLPIPDVDGPQHDQFEDTFPKEHHNG